MIAFWLGILIEMVELPFDAWAKNNCSRRRRRLERIYILGSINIVRLVVSKLTKKTGSFGKKLNCNGEWRHVKS